MLHFVLKRFVRLGLSVFCEDVNIRNKTALMEKGPILLVANHPDSFLDAIIIGAYYKRKIHFLARGDVFKNPIFGYLLRKIGMIPIHRIREGKEHLHRNSSTFHESVEILKAGGAILIFIEGICLNNHEIQPFKKGATRILEEAHQQGVFPFIHVASLGYNSFRSFGKVVDIQIEKMEYLEAIKEPKDRLAFNSKVKQILQRNLIVPSHIIPTKKNLIYYLVWPYYRIIQKYVDKKTTGTVFYDSVLFAVLLFTFPMYVLLLIVIVYIALVISC
jgi:1-acyl-sn-glycerol-3-phosphate acyltransferase